MSLAKMPSVREGGAYFEPILWPWPPEDTTAIVTAGIDGGFLYLFADPLARLRLIITEAHGEQETMVADGYTCPLDMPERLPLKIAVGWKPGQVNMEINGQWVISGDGVHQIPERLKVTPLRDKGRMDFSAENLLAQSKRHDRLVGWQGIRGENSYAEDGVKTAIKQLKDFITHIENDDLHHAESLLSLLRKLITTGDPMPQIQLVAALHNKPLIVFGERNPPKREIPHARVTVGPPPWPVPTEVNDNPMDLDVWLELFWGNFGETIGSHFDWNKHPTSIILKGVSSDLGGVRRDYLVRYILHLGKTALALAESVFASE